MHLAAYGADAAAEGRGDLGLGQVVVVAQHHDRPLLGRQPAQHLGQGQPQRCVRLEVASGGGLRDGANSELVTVPAPAPPADALVVHGGAHVGVRRPGAVHRRPSRGQLRQRRLQEVLGVLPVARDQHRRPEQHRLPRRHVLAKLPCCEIVHPTLPRFPLVRRKGPRLCHPGLRRSKWSISARHPILSGSVTDLWG